jgi:hypothetical protein
MIAVKLTGTYEAATPQPGGGVTVFEVSQPYRPGTLAVYVNGQRKIGSLDDGFTEIPPKLFHTKETLSSGDTLEVEYEPAP